MEVTVEQVKKLRDATGAGMMDAKKALVEAGGDVDKATELLRLAGVAKAEKKADRVAEAGAIEAYVHGGRIGVLVEVNCETDFVARTADFKTFVHDLAMHVAASNPTYVRPEDVPAAAVDKETELVRQELQQQGKPEAMYDKIMPGKLDKFYEQICLVRQPFVKDPDKTIDQLTKELIGKLGENIVIRRFARFELGQA